MFDTICFGEDLYCENGTALFWWGWGCFQLPAMITTPNNCRLCHSMRSQSDSKDGYDLYHRMNGNRDPREIKLLDISEEPKTEEAVWHMRF
jgi:hypothetical protein